MLENPDLPEEKIIASVEAAYGLRVGELAFLPLGADANTAVYRLVAAGGTPYFLKLRRGDFAEIAVSLPRFLSEQGIRQIIAPLATDDGALWAGLNSFRLILYPFVGGRDGYEVALSEAQWAEFGATLRRIHAASLPADLLRQVPQEAYSPRWREEVRDFLSTLETETYRDPAAVDLAALLRARRAQVRDLLTHTERLAADLQTRPADFVLCHSDLHAGNLLITEGSTFYIVDWDNPILAPPERDLMYIGGAQGFLGCTPQKEEALFYRGYGPARVDPAVLAYYRCERIVQDIAAYCEQIFLSDEGGADRPLAVRYVASNFLPGGTLEAAYSLGQYRPAI